MFGSEVSVPFLDDGAHGDGGAGDGIYGASIPASASDARADGALVHQRHGHHRHEHLALPALHRPQRFPGLPRHGHRQSGAHQRALRSSTGSCKTSPPPTPRPARVARSIGTASSTTTSSAACAERARRVSRRSPYKFDFNPGDHFRFQPGQPRVDELNLNSTLPRQGVCPRAAVVRNLSPGRHARLRLRSTCACSRTARSTASPSSSSRWTRPFSSGVASTPTARCTRCSTASLPPPAASRRRRAGTKSNSDLQAVVTGLGLGSPNRATFLFDNFDMPAAHQLPRCRRAHSGLGPHGRRTSTCTATPKARGCGRCSPGTKTSPSGSSASNATWSPATMTAPPTPCKRWRTSSHPLFGTQLRTYVGT